MLDKRKFGAFPPKADASTLARSLDRLADVELQHGHVAAAELLAFRADQIRAAVSA